MSARDPRLDLATRQWVDERIEEYLRPLREALAAADREPSQKVEPEEPRGCRVCRAAYAGDEQGWLRLDPFGHWAVPCGLRFDRRADAKEHALGPREEPSKRVAPTGCAVCRRAFTDRGQGWWSSLLDVTSALGLRRRLNCGSVAATEAEALEHAGVKQGSGL